MTNSGHLLVCEEKQEKIQVMTPLSGVVTGASDTSDHM